MEDKKIKNGNKSHFAFTLAEVLLTLVIIGVVAAITIPTIVNSTERQSFVTGLKKVNADLNRATKQILHNNGYMPGELNAFYDELNFINELIKISNVTQVCYTFSSCFNENPNKKHVTLHNQAFNPTECKSFISANNIIYGYTNNVSTVYGLSPEDTAKTIGRMIVDVNGLRGPNKLGYDTFIFYLVDEKGFLPAGSYSNTYCQSNHQAGFDCAARVLRENAINY